MLSSARLLRSRVASTALRSTVGAASFSRPVVHKILIRRQQHTEAIDDGKPVTLNRKDEGTKKGIPERRESPFKDLETEYLRKLKEEKRPVREVYGELTLALDEISPKSRSSFHGRISFGRIFTELINASIEEIKDNLTVTPSQLLQTAIQYNCADVVTFEAVADYEFKNGGLQEILSLWVTYLEYQAKNRIGAPLNKLREITLLAYVENCVTNGKTPDKETASQLLQADLFFNRSGLVSRLDRDLGDQNPRYAKIKAGIETFLLSNRDPNSLRHLKAATLGAEQRKFYMINNAYEEVQKIAKASGKKINEETLVLFMSFFNKAGAAAHAMKCWNDIIKSGVKPSTQAWNNLLDTISTLGPFPDRLSNVEKLFAKIPEKNDDSYCKMIAILGRFNKPEKIEELIDEKTLSKPYIAQGYARNLLNNNELEKALKIIKDHITSAGVRLSKETYNSLISAYVKAKKYGDAKNTFNAMIKSGIKADVATYSFLLHMTFKEIRARGELIDDGLISRFLSDMHANGVEPNVFTLTSLVDGLGKDASNIGSAMSLFQYLQSKKLTNAATYTSMISSMFNAGNSRQAELYFQDYVKAGYPLTMPIWNLMFEGFRNVENSGKGLDYYRLLKQSSDSLPRLNKFGMYFLMTLARNTKNSELANELLQDLEKLDINELPPTVVPIIKDIKRIMPEVAIPVRYEELLK